MISEKTAVVFGGTGFLGRAVVRALAKKGFRVRVPTRDIEKIREINILGEVGQIETLPVSVRSDAAVAAALEEADTVINLIGILAEKGRDTFQSVHVETAARLSRLARAAGVKNFVHVSALGADKKASSRYARSKALGEEAVRAFFPKAVILRPSILFGPRDCFLNRFARMARFSPVLPLIGGGKTRFQPVYVGDAAEAVLACLKKPEAQGRVFALGGPKIYTFKELLVLLLEIMGLKRRFLTLPWGLAKLLAFFLAFLPDPPLTRDQVELLKTDNVVPPHGAAKNFTALDLEPRALEQILPGYLEKFDEQT